MGSRTVVGKFDVGGNSVFATPVRKRVVAVGNKAGVNMQHHELYIKWYDGLPDEHSADEYETVNSSGYGNADAVSIFDHFGFLHEHTHSGYAFFWAKLSFPHLAISCSKSYLISCGKNRIYILLVPN